MKKNYPEELSNFVLIQINATLYQRNDATPLYIKNDDSNICHGREP